ncbi:hypothetical protein B0O99DRAFT_693091 [Bisporella sp. PMI_857]|nr:hypothetical protein B0O99DRAFT_693091 [Bisporella sp. PMI_857]
MEPAQCSQEPQNERSTTNLDDLSQIMQYPSLMDPYPPFFNFDFDDSTSIFDSSFLDFPFDASPANLGWVSSTYADARISNPLENVNQATINPEIPATALLDLGPLNSALVDPHQIGSTFLYNDSASSTEPRQDSPAQKANSGTRDSDCTAEPRYINLPVIPKYVTTAGDRSQFGLLELKALRKKRQRRTATDLENRKVKEKRKNGDVCLPCQFRGRKCEDRSGRQCKRCIKFYGDWFWNPCIPVRDRLPTLSGNYRLRDLPIDLNLDTIRTPSIGACEHCPDGFADARQVHFSIVDGLIQTQTQYLIDVDFNRRMKDRLIDIMGETCYYSAAMESAFEENVFVDRIIPHMPKDDSGRILFELGRAYVAREFEGYDLVVLATRLFAHALVARNASFGVWPDCRTPSTEGFNLYFFGVFLHYVEWFRGGTGKDYVAICSPILHANIQLLGVLILEHEEIAGSLLALFQIRFSGMSPLNSGTLGDPECYQLVVDGLKQVKESLVHHPCSCYNKYLFQQIFRSSDDFKTKHRSEPIELLPE